MNTKLQIKLMYEEAQKRLADSSFLEGNLHSFSDSGYLLKLLAFELLLKTVALINEKQFQLNHNYQAIYEILPEKVRQNILSNTNDLLTESLENNELQKLLCLFKSNFVKLRYPHENYSNMNEEEYIEYSKLWIDLGAPENEAEYQYYPNQLNGILMALQKEVENYLAC